ncbi:AMP-binding protein [Sphaerospermopsis sp. FACHB-1094]|uniref:AMP-binding protein n=1 Tax=Sphaerospermopsis sp. FACHB-1094 TaxID=2692861 RepID=UPI001682CA74|nr:AMP-binding protein [Sphaerospermopsis sp. FACHB-1094]MBD2131436.1 AMP-binding protein [Sphaerospermopsis sp. FACHB-1094]
MKTLNLIDILQSRSVTEPDRLALNFLQDGEIESGRLTYQQLDQQARAIAAQLQSLQMQGERALLLYSPGLEFISAFFGCLYAGVIAIPAYLPRRERGMDHLLRIIIDATPKVILTTTSNLPDWSRRFALEPGLSSLSWLTTDNITPELGQQWQKPAIAKDTLAFLQYTSGSTAMPKGVMVSHGNLIHNLEQIYRFFGHTPDSRGVIWLPPYHDMGLIGGVLQTIYGGCTVTLMSPVAFLQKPLRWLTAISESKATTSGGPNFAYELCIEKITPEQRLNLDLSSWEVAFNGAEPIRPETLERFTQAFAPCGFRPEAFYPCYGMAEGTLIVSGGEKTSLPTVCQVESKAIQENQVATGESVNSKTFVAVGEAGVDQQILIVDPQNLTQCPSDRVGEIWLSGASVTLGYWQKPAATQQTFQAYLSDTQQGPFLRTGDLGFIHNGQLFITGRLKDLIIIRGQNHYPQDIELTVEQSHPALRMAGGAAFSVEVDGVERLAIAYEVERNYLRHLDVDEVVAAIRQAISEVHGLQVYAILLLKTGTIPKTSSGKIQRYSCRTSFLENTLEIVGQWQEPLINPVDLESLALSTASLEQQFSQNSTITVEQIQTWLINRLSTELKIPPQEIDIQEAFAYYGLDSSAAIAITGELIDWLECEVEPTLFWEYPNIEELASYLAQVLSESSVKICV